MLNLHLLGSVFATGYRYSYNFADVAHEPFKSFPLTRRTADIPTSESSEETAPGMRVHNLDDRLLFYLPDPTLAILTAPYLVSPLTSWGTASQS